MKIINVRHSWPEKEGFFLSRNRNNKDYIFLHFFNSVEISYGGNTYNTLPNSVVIFRPSTHHSYLSRVPLKHNWFLFSLKSEEEIANFGIESDKIYSIQDGDFITKILRTVENEFLAPKSYSDELICVKLNELFIKLALQERESKLIKLKTICDDNGFDYNDFYERYDGKAI